jgi:hypothetical protein
MTQCYGWMTQCYAEWLNDLMKKMQCFSDTICEKLWQGYFTRVKNPWKKLLLVLEKRALNFVVEMRAFLKQNWFLSPWKFCTIIRISWIMSSCNTSFFDEQQWRNNLSRFCYGEVLPIIDEKSYSTRHLAVDPDSLIAALFGAER